MPVYGRLDCRPDARIFQEESRQLGPCTRLFSPMPLVDIESFTGLTPEAAAGLLSTEGYNELPESKKRSIFRIVFEVIHEPMFLLLVASGSIYFLLGDVSEGLMLMSFVLVIIGITVYQEQKTERALDHACRKRWFWRRVPWPGKRRTYHSPGSEPSPGSYKT